VCARIGDAELVTPYSGDDLLGKGCLSPPDWAEGDGLLLWGIPQVYPGHQEEQEREGMTCAWGAEAERTHCCVSFIHIHRDFITTCPSGQVELIGDQVVLVTGGKPEGGC
jgi:hypothetical protein